MVNRIEFPVGDYSDDGHGRCDYYYVDSNKTVDQVAEIHKNASSVLGFEIGDIAAEYECPYIDAGIMKKLYDLKFNVDPYLEEEGIDLQGADKAYVNSEGVFKLWVALLQFVDPTFEYKIVEPLTGSSLAWRLLGLPGYGCFE